MPCEKIKFDEITEEFLRQGAEVYARQIYDSTKNPDSLANWIEGKKLVAFTIVDSYVQNCITTSQCLPLPACCHEYLKELSIQDVKKFKAYFIWENRDGKKEPENNHVSDYDAAYNEIIPLCSFASEKPTGCTYLLDILFKIEKRKNFDRRLMKDSTYKGTMKHTRLNEDRRKNGRMNIVDEFLMKNYRPASQSL